MCTFKTAIIYLKTLARLDVIQEYGTIAVFVKNSGFSKMLGFCLTSKLIFIFS